MTAACTDPASPEIAATMHTPAITSVPSRRLIAVWVVLMLSMLGSWVSLGSMAVTLATAIVIALALLKAMLVVAYYMEVADAPRWLKALCGTWIALVFTIVAVSHVAPAWMLARLGY